MLCGTDDQTAFGCYDAVTALYCSCSCYGVVLLLQRCIAAVAVTALCCCYSAVLQL